MSNGLMNHRLMTYDLRLTTILTILHNRMPQLIPFGSQVELIMLVGGYFYGNIFYDLQIVAD